MKGWSTRVALHRTEIATILDALHELRDREGGQATVLELRLQELLRLGDEQKGQ